MHQPFDKLQLGMKRMVDRVEDNLLEFVVQAETKINKQGCHGAKDPEQQPALY
jgi:hypothetical protein